MPDLFLEIREDDAAAGITPAPPLTDGDAVDLLRQADFTASKLIPWGSNYTFAVALECPDGREHLAIYKPRAGEAPLYDFPDGTLYRRECAAYLLSHRLGWGIVPPTVVRQDGPNGVGSLQLYVEPTPDSPELRHFWSGCGLDIERLVLFDHVANNADRKIGHCLRDRGGKVWGIDHGLTFNRHYKLRTVLWQFVGQPVAAELLGDLQRLRLATDAASRELAPLLDTGEIAALWSRIDRIIESGQYPALNPRRNVPYGWW